MPRSFLVKKQHSSRRPNYGTLDFKTEEAPGEDSFLHSAIPSLHHCPHMAPQLQRCSCSLCVRAERAQLPAPSNSLPLSIVDHRSAYTGMAYTTSPAEALEVAESCTGVDLEIQHATGDHRRKQQFLPQHPPLLSLCPAITSSSCSQDSFEYLDCHEDHLHFSPLTKYKQLQCEWSSKKYFSCKYCEKEYVSLGALKMHIRTHTLPCVCPVCGKAFSRPWLLQGHIRTHTGEKPFSCRHCHRAFADRSNLRAHLQTHSDVKKYQCASCFKTFSRISLLAKHHEAGCCLS